MRKKLSIILALTLMITSFTSMSYSIEDLLVRVPEIIPVEIAAGTEINSYPKGIELLKNSYYNDINTNAYEEDITKMSAFGVINKMGSDNYNPEQNVTGYKALEVLVNLMGNGAAVQTRALAGAQGMDASGVKRTFNQEYETEAIALGIITNAELSNYNDDINRETFALWVSRAAAVPAEITNLNNVYSFEDFGDIPTSSRALVEALIQNNIMPVGNDGNFRAKDKLTKGELANIANNSSEFMKTALNIVTNYGVVSKLIKDSSKIGETTISTNDIVIKNVDGSNSTLKTSYNNSTRQKFDFVVDRNGVVTDSSSLKVGDQIEYVMKDNELRYVVVKESENFATQISDMIKNQEDIKTYFATIGNISNEQKWDNNQYINRDRYRIKTFDGQTVDLLIDANKDTGIINDATVLKDGVLGGASLLKTGDQVEYLLKDNKLVYMAVKDLKSTEIPSTVRYVYKDPLTGNVTLTIFDYNDQILEYPVSQNVLVLINDNYGEVTDLQYAQDIIVTVINGQVTKVVSESFVENPGFIPQFGKVRFGIVNYVYPDSINMELSNGEMLHFKVKSDIPIIKNGEMITFRALKQGDKVKVYFDNITTLEASALEVEAAERLVKQIYKGNVTDVNEFSKKITLDNLEYIKNSNWERNDVFIKDFKVSDDVEIYLKGNKIPIEDLSKIYKNSTIYAVVEDSFGKDLIVKMNIQEGGERFYYDKVKDIDRAVGELELNDKTNFRFDEGSIVIKDSRVLDYKRLTVKSDVFVVSGFNTYYDNYANVVKVQSKADDVFENIYIGAVEQVHGSYFNMKDYTTVSDNIWDSVKTTNSQNFYFNNSSMIYEQTSNKTLKYYELFNGSYSRSENYEKTPTSGLNYKRYYGVVVTNDKGQVVALNLRHKGILKGQNFDDTLKTEDLIAEEVEKTIESTILTRGIIDEIQSDWDRIKLTDASDWIDSRGMWVANPTDKYVEYDESLIMKDGESVKYTDLKTGDYIFIVRTKEKALVITVE